MHAAVLTAPGLDALDVVEVAVPRPAAGEVLIRVETVGVNQLDLNVIAGRGPGAAAKLPRVLGLDPAGVIVAVGDGVPASRVGEAVVVKPNIPCGTCSWCTGGAEADCPDQTVVGVHRDGGAAQFIAVPARSAFDRGMLPAAVASAAVHSVPIVLHALEAARLAPGDRVLVTGAGGTLGRVAVALAAHRGAEVVAASRSVVPAPAGVRAVRVVDADDLRARLDGARFDVSLDVSGDARMLSAGVAALGWAGRAVFVAASVDPVLSLDARDFYLNRKRLIGAASASRDDVRRALDLVAAGAVVPLIGERHPLTDIREAYRTFPGSPPGKVIIDVA